MHGRTQRKLPAVLAPLTQIDQWVTWKFVIAKDGRKVKPPYQCNGRPAKSNDPDTWSTFAEAAAASDKIGLVLRGSGIGAIDLDDCFNPDTEEITDWAQKIID
jgi:putative DNA primase/helicase